MKAVWDRILQVIILVVATGLTISFALDKKVQQLLPSLASHIDEKAIIPITAGLVYVLLFLIIAMLLKVPFLRKRIDKKYIYTGRYLSLPHNPDEISILEITSGFFDTKYRLTGHSYSLANLRATGGWNADSLDLKSGGRVTYIYTGHEIDQNTRTSRFDGHGYAKIQFGGQKLEEGSGSWIDDDPALVRKNSTYVKLTRSNRKRVKKGQNWFKRFIWWFVWPDKSVIAAFNALPAADKSAAPFIRPTS